MKAIERSFNYLASMIAGKMGVRVVVEKNGQARTDGKTIWIPDGYDFSLGFLYHEGAHCRFTNFDIWVESIKQSSKPNIFKHIMNSFEDGMIEKEIVILFPGSYSALSELVNGISQKGYFGEVGNEVSKASSLTNKILLGVRAKNQGYECLKEVSEYYDQKFIEFFGEEISQKIDDIISKASGISSTFESSELTKEVFEVLNEYLENQKNKDDKSDDKSDDASSGGLEDLDDLDEISKNIKEIFDSEEEFKLFEDFLQEIAEKEGAEKAQYGHGSDTVLLGVKTIAKGSKSYGLELKTQTSFIVGSMVKQLKILMQSRAMEENRYSSSGNNLSIDRVINSYASSWTNDKIFVHKDFTNSKNNTAVQFLIDNSGSMEDFDRHVLAKQALMAFLSAISTIEGVKTSASIFPYEWSNVNEGYVGQLMKFGENLNNVLDRFHFKPYGGTPLGAAIRNSVFDLINQNAERRLLIVLTDGAPGDSNVLSDALKEIKEDGRVEIVAIGIQNNSVSHYFDNYKVITNLDELVPAVISLARDKIIKL